MRFMFGMRLYKIMCWMCRKGERAMDEMDEYQEWLHMTWGFGMEGWIHGGVTGAAARAAAAAAAGAAPEPADCGGACQG